MAWAVSKITCLVAGGAGFVGANLCRRLLSEGVRVDCVDNISTGRLENISDLLTNPKFRFVYLDITKSDELSDKLQRRYSRVYHLACPTGVPNIALLGEEMLAACSIGTRNLFEIAKRSKALFLYASSAEAYGDPQISPQSEDYVGHVDPVGPRSPYEVGKRFGEATTRFLGAKYDVPVRIVRLFNTYGTHMSPRDTRVIPQMLSHALDGIPLPIYGDGLQTRTFLHVDDLIDAFEFILTKGMNGSVYNIGGLKETRIVDLVDFISSASGQSMKVEFRPHFIQDHTGRWPDTSKVRALGWLPKISLKDGISRSYREFLSAIAHPPAQQRRTVKTAPLAPTELGMRTGDLHEQRA